MVTVTETIPQVLPEIFPPSVPREVTTADVLNGAADRIERYGWVQGTHGNEKIGQCIWGAVMSTTMFDLSLAPDKCNAHEDAISVLLRRLTGYVPTTYNDTPGRTKEEVVFLLREAAECA